MIREDLDIAIRMIAGGRVQHPAVLALADVLWALMPKALDAEPIPEAPLMPPPDTLSKTRKR